MYVVLGFLINAFRRRVRALYDPSVEVLSIRFRDGEARYVIEGVGNFAVFADEHGVWGVDIEVKKWLDNYEEATNTLKKAKTTTLNTQGDRLINRRA